MPRYVVERSFPDGLVIPINEEGAKAAAALGVNNAAEGVNWVQTFVSSDKKKTYCVYDSPNPEAIRRAATKNGLPVDKMTEVSVLSPSFYF